MYEVNQIRASTNPYACLSRCPYFVHTRLSTASPKWAHDGERQVLHAEITENPAAQYDETLEHDVLVNFPTWKIVVSVIMS